MLCDFLIRFLWHEGCIEKLKTKLKWRNWLELEEETDCRAVCFVCERLAFGLTKTLWLYKNEMLHSLGAESTSLLLACLPAAAYFFFRLPSNAQCFLCVFPPFYSIFSHSLEFRVRGARPFFTWTVVVCLSFGMCEWYALHVVVCVYVRTRHTQCLNGSFAMWFECVFVCLDVLYCMCVCACWSLTKAGDDSSTICCLRSAILHRTIGDERSFEWKS